MKFFKRKKVEDIHVLLLDCINENQNDFYRLAYSYVKNEEDALDIIQVSIEKALLNFETIKKTTSVKSWFYKIVVCTSIDFLRKEKKVKCMDISICDCLNYGIKDNYEYIDIHSALNQLPMQYKTIILLRYFEDLKIEEIAEIVEENVNTVKTRLYRALKLLRTILTEGEIL
ncbi:sigma-70 family RNA polymerase sigma factor [Bacillus thuringiensis]|uniref:RNA polymerase subunit sigma-70 n=2 Tax=Bacillus cereus group TaxID=86661 RepID=A0A9W3TBM7_BACTU|nr:sigma-70 family RNA polymerase sigma factor [Bacillus thuringiensis]AQY38373.1 RNA polymerase subunit sigma-70 [Bacillus thuringiensis]KIP23991.1 RNA polymerase sigma factor sigV [Bacillus thuringiensis serovar morrisoni]MCT6943863.1 sigma-70 family RNA polymerase sigma factor [Bacillus thuringiensis]MDR4151166.1 sigma-70 family RNA polymerase sigma factor [Bacillus thuringiensis]MEC3572196.1 sigma-70 family RNA polymerase sigma factor [Bacillus thuringiensis]